MMKIQIRMKAKMKNKFKIRKIWKKPGAETSSSVMISALTNLLTSIPNLNSWMFHIRKCSIQKEYALIFSLSTFSTRRFLKKQRNPTSRHFWKSIPEEASDMALSCHSLPLANILICIYTRMFWSSMLITEVMWRGLGILNLRLGYFEKNEK